MWTPSPNNKLLPQYPLDLPYGFVNTVNPVPCGAIRLCESKHHAGTLFVLRVKP